jgi:hypothetical protein
MTNPRARAVDTFTWEAEILGTDSAEDALFELCRLAGIDPLQTRATWDTDAVLAKVRSRRRILLAQLRKLRHEQPDAPFTAAMHEVMTWILLVTGCEFSAAHKRELIAGIQNDACYIRRELYRKLSPTSLRNRRVAALELLLTNLNDCLTSDYVPQGSRSLFAWLRHRGTARRGADLQAFSRTDIHF